MGVPINFGDEVGPITDRMCDKCDNYVYENAACDPRSRYDVWKFLCLVCDERLFPMYTSTQAMRDERKALNEFIKVNRYKFRQQEAIRKREEREKKGEQMSLWDSI